MKQGRATGIASVAVSLAIVAMLVATAMVRDQVPAEHPPQPPQVAAETPQAATERPPTAVVVLPPPPQRQAAAPFLAPPPPAPPPAPVREALKPEAPVDVAPAQDVPPPLAAAAAPQLAIVPLRPDVPHVAAPEATPVAPLRAEPRKEAELARAPEPAPLAPVRAQTEPPRPARQAAAEPVQVPATGPAPAPAPEAAIAEGRTLLRLLEHGAGPEIEIAWPAAPAQRESLFQMLRGCFGMELALMDAAGRLYRPTGAAAPWTIDLDRYSGFVRDVAGTATRDEVAEAAAANRLHGSPASARPVRVFPRRVDALVLGTLRQLIGPGYDAAHSIHANYRHDGWRVALAGIVVDGAPVSGEVDLSGVRLCVR